MNTQPSIGLVELTSAPAWENYLSPFRRIADHPEDEGVDRLSLGGRRSASSGKVIVITAPYITERMASRCRDSAASRGE